MMNQRWLCNGAELVDGGRGVRFEVLRHGVATAAFVVRHRGAVQAYLNSCGHVPVELDWQPGEFFDTSGAYLICSVHGAMYDPRDGRCVGGRCNGHGLQRLDVVERDGQVYLLDVAND